MPLLCAFTDLTYFIFSLVFAFVTNLFYIFPSFRVCEMLYEKRKEYDKILSCYWRDSARKHQAFSYIQVNYILYNVTYYPNPSIVYFNCLLKDLSSSEQQAHYTFRKHIQNNACVHYGAFSNISNIYKCHVILIF